MEGAVWILNDLNSLETSYMIFFLLRCLEFKRVQNNCKRQHTSFEPSLLLLMLLSSSVSVAVTYYFSWKQGKVLIIDVWSEFQRRPKAWAGGIHYYVTSKVGRKKKLAFLASTSTKALTPPPLLLIADIAILCNFFLLIWIYMFLKQEKPEMDDFEKEQKLCGSTGKILENIVRNVPSC